ncbi:glycine--tRNA ligase [Candidatus Microgenomates bacterium]|nr:glycine--tRNA ligase [Candidatus Microgenomates bacterium]
MDDLMKKIVSLSKRRGFVYPGSQIYGGLANTWDYGPLGTMLMKNIRDSWWTLFITQRRDMFPLDSGILMSPRVWEASGHTSTFNDMLIDCRNCKLRTRADHLIEEHFEEKKEEIKVEGLSSQDLADIIQNHGIVCPKCKKIDWTAPRAFNLLFETNIGIVPENQSKAYLRGETAQGIFVNFKQVVESMRPKLPFGIGQIGKSFRNEITKGNFVFRTLEFEQAEIEYFFDPEQDDWRKLFNSWKDKMQTFVVDELGIDKAKLRWRKHTDDERSHYSRHTEDLDYKFPFGYKELWGIAYRTDFDLKQHMEESGQDLRYLDPQTNKKLVPHVIEPAVGVNRLFLMVLVDAYTEEEKRTVLKLKPSLAPYVAAIFPLLGNKPELKEKAKAIYDKLQKYFSVTIDERGNIGKRYFAQDEIGTPLCITVDFETLTDGAVTIRERDTMAQSRVAIDKIVDYINDIL